MKNLKTAITIFIKGLIMGAADIIPGVSGGTMALITGIYEEFIISLDSLKNAVFGRFKKIRWGFLLPLASGILIAVLLLSGLLSYLLNSYTGRTFSFFSGLIVIITFSVFRMIRPLDLQKTLFLILGTAISFIIAGLSPASAGSTSLLYLYISGFLAVSAMMLPGISGSFILLLLGVYPLVLRHIHSLALLLSGRGGNDFSGIIPLLVLFSGILTGLISVSGIIRRSLEKHKSVTLSLLAGFMAGALRKPVREIFNSLDSFPLCAVLFAAGIITGLLLNKTGVSSEKDRPA